MYTIVGFSVGMRTRCHFTSDCAETLDACPAEPIIMTTPHSIVLRHSLTTALLFIVNPNNLLHPMIHISASRRRKVVTRYYRQSVIAAFAYRIRDRDKSVVKGSDPRYLCPRVSGKYSAALESSASV